MMRVSDRSPDFAGLQFHQPSLIQLRIQICDLKCLPAPLAVRDSVYTGADPSLSRSLHVPNACKLPLWKSRIVSSLG